MDLRSCRAKYRALAPTLTERSRRVWAATEARDLGRGGSTLVARATGISTSTITRGLSELQSRARLAAGRVRRPGGGRKRTVDKDPTLLRRDPYGHRWLMTVQVPDEESTVRNLIPANLVRDWMHEAVARLYARQPQLAGAAAAEAGPPVEDLCAVLPEVLESAHQRVLSDLWR